MLTELARARARGLLNALAGLLASLHISPNTLTIVGLLGMFLSGFVIALGHESLGGILMVVAGLFDAVDGSLARLTRTDSKFGAFLDSTLDRWAESALYFAIVCRGVARPDAAMVYLAVLALVGSQLVSYARARAEGLGASVKEGWFTRLERLIVLAVGLILVGWFGPIVLDGALALIAFFANITAVQRVLAARRVLH